MKNVLLITLILIALFAISQPRLTNKGQNTQFKYYLNKYNDVWELTDSTLILGDTIYVYTLCGQHFTFNQDGTLLLNSREINKCKQ